MPAHLPRPNLSLESIKLLTDYVRRPTVTELDSVFELQTQVTNSENESKAKTVMSTSTNENESKTRDKRVERAMTFVSPKANDNFGTQETQKIDVISPLPSMNTGTPPTEFNISIDTNKKSNDFSFLSSSPPLWTTQNTNVTSDASPTARRPINALVGTHVLSNDASRSTNLTSSQVPNATSTNTTLPCESQNTVSSSVLTSQCSTTKSTNSTCSSRSSTNQSSSATNSPNRSTRNPSLSTTNSSSLPNTKLRRRKNGKRYSETRLAQDVDNYVGNKAIDELVKFIEG